MEQENTVSRDKEDKGMIPFTVTSKVCGRRSRLGLPRGQEAEIHLALVGQLFAH